MISAKVICDSVSATGVRLTTLEVTFPRFILAEVNTHRMLSKSSASSRAIPVAKRIQAVLEDPFVPEVFGKNQKGMQAAENVDDKANERAREEWLKASEYEVFAASQLAKLDVHKQYANRLLEPFCWHTAVITATEWNNFFALRCHPDAQPEFQTIARMMRSSLAESTPKAVWLNEWHLPYVRGVDEERLREEGYNDFALAAISCARSGRVSYLTQDGRRSPDEDVALYDRYLASFHMSPLEHAATPFDESNEGHTCVAMVPFNRFAVFGGPMIGNLCGWVQQRKLVPNEHDFSLRGPK